MRPRWGLLAFLAAVLAAACPGPGAPPARMADQPAVHSQLAEEDRYAPSYGKPELSKALIAERAAEATGERIVAELEAREPRDDDRLRAAVADLAVRRRFIASLEACEAAGRWCPPRLDDPPWTFDVLAGQPPPLDAPLRFDQAAWRTIASELHGRGCACRTLACVDGVGVAIDQLEARPNRDVQGDEVASVSITRARECLFRLRGKARRTRAPEPG